MTTVIEGVLSLALCLGVVAETRSDLLATAYPVTRDPADYTCLLGVRHGHADLIDQELWFIGDDGWISGPLLVVDVEAAHHAPYMEVNDLAADTDCEYLVHRRGRLVMRAGD